MSFDNGRSVPFMASSTSLLTGLSAEGHSLCARTWCFSTLIRLQSIYISPRPASVKIDTSLDLSHLAAVMSHNQEKQLPLGASFIAQDGGSVCAPGRVALSNTSTVVESPRLSGDSMPHTEKSGNPFDSDVEAMVQPGSSAGECGRIQICRKSDKHVWPGKEHWKQKAKAAKMKRSCSCMAQLSRRNRLIAKVLIVVLIVGVAVGVGFGVSKPLGAPIWGKKTS